MRKKLINKTSAILLTTSMMLSISGCGSNSNNQNESNPEIAYQNNKITSLSSSGESISIAEKELDDDFRIKNADFSLNLLKVLAKDNENVLISPESIITALGMTANGADGETLICMQDVIAGGMSIDDFNSYMLNVQNSQTSNTDVKFNLANSIWFRDDENMIQVKDSFLDINQKIYKAEVYKAQFNDSTVNEINSWVKKNTDDMIPSIINQINPDDVMYLINATCFDAEWNLPYEDYQIHENSEFTNNDGSKSNVTMLHSDEAIYVSDENATGFLKYYKGCRFAFMALLPKEGMSTSAYLNTLSGDGFVKMFNNRSYETVITRTPAFTYDYETSLKQPLINIGMENPFTGNAYFNNMADNGNELYIGDVIHKTHIQLDRSGTKAAAVTAVIMKCESAMVEPSLPKEVFLNRPFVYSIVDTETGLPVFIGTVNTFAE